jgi:hypothetical protein
MAHFAELDQNNIVLRVLVVNNQDCLDENNQESENVGVDFLNKIIGQANWVKTSYNTYGNLHYNSDTKIPDNGVPFRGNYAGIGYIYDKTNDVFYPPRPLDRNNIQCDSWIISASTDWLWAPPIPYPQITQRYGQFKWDEPTKTWIEYTWDKPDQKWVEKT